MIKQIWDEFKQRVRVRDLIIAFVVSFFTVVSLYPMIGPLDEKSIIGLMFLVAAAELAFSDWTHRRAKKKQEKKDASKKAT